jgi:hypothetical protein
MPERLPVDLSDPPHWKAGFKGFTKSPCIVIAGAGSLQPEHIH